MKIIGLDSSGLVAGVAVVQDDILLAEYTTNYKKTHSQTLLPMLDEIRSMIDLDLNDVDAIALACGPGSFTGLRIGSATAKGIGMAIGKPIVEVPTLEGLAFNVWGTDKLVCPLMDARRGQVYAGIYSFPGARERSAAILNEWMEQTALSVAELAEKLNEIAEKENREVILLGDGVPVYRDLLEQTLTVPHLYAPASCNRQRAASVASLGAMYFAKGMYVSADDHSPIYLRKSQAENEGPQDFKI